MFWLEGIVVVVCVFNENKLFVNFVQLIKFYYVGLMFCYECLQMGCYCQFYQFGIEVIGLKDFVIDVEVMVFVMSIY